MSSPKTVLFLGYGEDKTRLPDFVRSRGFTVAHTAERIQDLSSYGVVVSYGYAHLLSNAVLATATRPPINLHISYLPYNRGADPNFWAFVEGTPSGVTIHEIDGGVDTGPIVAQRRVTFDATETTFKTTYQRLIREIEDLFVENADAILYHRYAPMPQSGEGTFHRGKDLPADFGGWDAEIAAAVARYRKARTGP